jgi:GST-like protein
VIDLYSWTTPNGRKISIMLEETGLDYRVHPVDIGAGEQHTEDYGKIAPSHKIPAIVDNDTGRAIMETGAILYYLAEKAGMLLPGDEEGRWQVMQWVMWQMGNFGPMLGQAHHFLKFNPGKAPYAEERYAGIVQRLYGDLDRRLEGRKFVAGDAYTIADIAIWPWAARFEWHRANLDDFPNVKRWYCDIAARPAVQRGYHVPNYTADIPMPG